VGRGIWTGGSADRPDQVKGADVRRPADFGAARVRVQRGSGQQRDRARLPGSGDDIADRLAPDVAEVRPRVRRHRGPEREVHLLDDVHGDPDPGVALPADPADLTAVPDVQDVVFYLVFRAHPGQRLGVHI